MAKEIVSIDIGEAFITIAVGRLKGDILVVKKLQILNTPEGAIVDEKIQDSKAAEILKKYLKQEFFNKNRSLFKKNLTIIMGNSNTINRQLNLPSIEGGNLASAIKYEMEGYLPTGSSDYIIRHNILEEIGDEEGYKNLRIFVGAASKKTIDDFYAFAKSLKVKPIALNMCSDSAQKLYNLCSKINDIELAKLETVVLLDMGFSNISVNIVRGGALEQSGIIRSGGKQIRNSIAATFDYTDSEAEAQINQHGSLRDKAGEAYSLVLTDEEKYVEALNDIIRSTLDTSTEEIRRVFTYYLSRNVGYKIDHVFAYGYMTRLDGLTSYLTQSLNIPVTRIEKLDGFKLDKKLESSGKLTLARVPGTYSFEISFFINTLGGLIQD